MKDLCGQCEKRPVKYFRRPRKYQGLRKKVIVKSGKLFNLCNQCHNRQFETLKQIRLAEARNRPFEEI